MCEPGGRAALADEALSGAEEEPCFLPSPALTTDRPVISGAGQSELGKSRAFHEIMVVLLLADMDTSKPENREDVFLFRDGGGEEKSGSDRGPMSDTRTRWKRKGFDGSVGTGVLHGELQRLESVPCARPD